EGAGIAARHFADSRISIRAGVPGERLQLAAGRPRRAVADLLRESGVPHWERGALPRVYAGERLAAVALLGVDAAFAAGPGEVGMLPEWRPAIRGAARRGSPPPLAVL
ncbi:MAG: tRNA lysidine(34) synthetase TilS, partial [Candidatus Levyibacteriota bacterium]